MVTRKYMIYTKPRHGTQRKFRALDLNNETMVVNNIKATLVPEAVALKQMNLLKDMNPDWRFKLKEIKQFKFGESEDQ